MVAVEVCVLVWVTVAVWVAVGIIVQVAVGSGELVAVQLGRGAGVGECVWKGNELQALSRHRPIKTTSIPEGFLTYRNT
jgi:hypothetical protein